MRFYAANLSRKRRSEPALACGDAIRQLAALGGTLATTIFVVVALAFSRSMLQHLYSLDLAFIGFVIALSALFTYLANRAFSEYSETPQVADAYRSSGTIRMANILYVVVPLLWVCLIGVVLRVLDPP